MSNSQVELVAPKVEIELGGKKRNLLFDFDALIKVEKATGKNALGEAFTNPSATVIATLVWAALQHEEKITLEQVAKMLHFGNLSMVGDAIRKAFELSAIPTEDLKKSLLEGSE